MAPPKKRRPGGSPVAHHGRTTGPVASRPPTAPRELSDLHSARPDRPRDQPVPASQRYTRPTPKLIRIRPDWHRRVGWVVVLSGLAVAVINDVPLFGGPSLLPFGHSELYLLAAIIVAATGTRWFGWFDRSNSR